MKNLLPVSFVVGCCSLMSLSVVSADTAGSEAVGAEESKGPITVFNKVVVSASRIEQTAQQETRTINEVDREQLDKTQPLSVAEALKFEPNVTIAGGPIPGNQSINIRGLEGNKVLQIVDGTRINTNFIHRPSYFLDPVLIKSISVVKGPGSSLWGSGAIGGVVLQQTLSANDIVEPNEKFGGLVKTGFNDNGDQRTASLILAGEQNSVSWLLGGSYLDSGLIEQGNNTLLFGSETENSTQLGKVDWQINAHNRVGINYRNADNDGHPPVVGSAVQQLNERNSLIDRSSTEEYLGFNYQYRPNTDLVDVDFKLYRNDTRISETNLNGGKDLSAIETTGFSVTNKGKYKKVSFLSGIDGYQDKLDTERPENEEGRPELPSNAKTTTLGAFVYADYPLTQSVVFEAGVRFDQFKSEAQGFSKSDESAISPSLAIRWQTRDWAVLSVRYDEAFRAPDVYELFLDGTHFSFFPGGPSNIFVPNPDLDPEESRNFEVKGEFTFQDVFAKDQFNLIASVFDNQINDFIQLSVDVPAVIPGFCFAPGMGAGCAGTSQSENVSQASLKGFELGAVYRRYALTMSLSYGQTRGKDDDTNEYLTGIPSDKWVAAVDYGIWSIDTKVGFKVIKTSDQDKIPSDDTQGPYDAYTTVDFYATWEPSAPSLEGIKVDLAITNAFDQNYRNPWTSVFEAGRSIRLAAQYRF